MCEFFSFFNISCGKQLEVFGNQMNFIKSLKSPQESKNYLGKVFNQ